VLRQLPLAGLKLAPRFVRTAPEDLGDRRVVEAVVALGGNLGLSVSAKGVASAEQLAVVRAAGCAEAQGDHLHPFLAADEVAALLRQAPPAG
jgi:EAL domain-containing protein (putative c-di-GMP-specific phosphodiesterase class I)